MHEPVDALEPLIEWLGMVVAAAGDPVLGVPNLLLCLATANRRWIAAGGAVIALVVALLALAGEEDAAMRLPAILAVFAAAALQLALMVPAAEIARGLWRFLGLSPEAPPAPARPAARRPDACERPPGPGDSA
jgi:hypothetical protein